MSETEQMRRERDAWQVAAHEWKRTAGIIAVAAVVNMVVAWGVAVGAWLNARDALAAATMCADLLEKVKL